MKRKRDPFAEAAEQHFADEHYELLASSNVALAALTGRVQDICDRPFVKSGHLVTADLDLLDEAYRDYPAIAVPSLFERDIDRSPTSIRPRAESFERIRVHASPGHGSQLSWLWTQTFFVSRELVVIENAPLPFSWASHAMARLVERGGRLIDVRSEIAKSLLEHSFMIAVATDLIVTENRPPRFTVPCGDGMVGGAVAPFVELGATACRTMISRDFCEATPIMPKALKRNGDFSEATTGWVGRTYIDEPAIGPNYRRYLSDLQRFQKKYQIVSRQVTQLQITSGSIMRPPEEALRGMSGDLLEAFKAASDDMRAIFKEHRKSRFCGGDNRARRRSWTVLPGEKTEPENELALAF